MDDKKGTSRLFDIHAKRLRELVRQHDRLVRFEAKVYSGDLGRQQDIKKYVETGFLAPWINILLGNAEDGEVSPREEEGVQEAEDTENLKKLALEEENKNLHEEIKTLQIVNRNLGLEVNTLRTEQEDYNLIVNHLYGQSGRTKPRETIDEIVGRITHLLADSGANSRLSVEVSRLKEVELALVKQKDALVAQIEEEREAHAAASISVAQKEAQAKDATIARLQKELEDRNAVVSGSVSEVNARLQTARTMQMETWTLAQQKTQEVNQLKDQVQKDKAELETQKELEKQLRVAIQELKGRIIDLSSKEALCTRDHQKYVEDGQQWQAVLTTLFDFGDSPVTRPLAQVHARIKYLLQVGKDGKEIVNGLFTVPGEYPFSQIQILTRIQHLVFVEKEYAKAREFFSSRG